MTTEAQTQETRGALIARLDEITWLVEEAGQGDGTGRIVCEQADDNQFTDEVFRLHDEIQRGSLYAENIRLAMHPHGLNGPTLIITGVDFDGNERNAAVTFSLNQMLSLGEFYMMQLISSRQLLGGEIPDDLGGE